MIIRLLTMVFIILSLTGCNSNDSGYLIKGEIKGNDEVLKKTRIFLRNISKEYIIIDSTNIINGKFTFKGHVETPDKYVLYVKELPNKIPLFLENDKYNITATYDSIVHYKVTGGETQQIINSIKEKDAKTRIKFDLDNTFIGLNDPDISPRLKDELIKTIEAANKEMKDYIDSIIKCKPVSFFTLSNTLERATTLDYTYLVKVYEGYLGNEDFKNNLNLKKLKSILEIREKLEPGKTAPDFALKNNNGLLQTLSDIYKNNSLCLIVFWASWDKNSTEYYRSLSVIYNNFNKKGLEIIGVSVNDNDISWKKALSKENLKWIHLIDNIETITTVLNSYDIQYIPYNMLVDSSGKIIAKNLTINELQGIIASKL